MSDAFDRALAAVFAAFGEDATCTPAGASGVAVRVLLRRPDKFIDVGIPGLQAPSWQAEARVAELPEGAARGDRLEVAGEAFVIRRIAFDAARRLATLDLDPVRP